MSLRLFNYLRKKVFKGHYVTDIKEISLKEDEPHEAKRRVFFFFYEPQAAKWSVFSKRKALWVCFIHILWMRFKWDLQCVRALCISYEWNAKKRMIMKRINLMCTSYEWGSMHSLNGMLRGYVYEKEISLCLALDAYLCA